jgi:hypothetical protein
MDDGVSVRVQSGRTTMDPPGPLPDVGLPGARTALTAGVRLTARAVELAELISHGRHGLVALPLLSLAADLRLLRKLQDPAWWPSWMDWVVDAADVGLRSALGAPDRPDELPSVVADVVPTGVLAGFQAAAGTTALPEVIGASPWPPSEPTAAGRAAARALGPLALAAVGHLVGARLGGRRARLVQFTQVAVVSTGLGVLLARHRDRLQAQVRDAYLARANGEIERARAAARINARTAPGPGHDFAKTLVALGRLGDAACEEAGRRALDTPRRLLEGRQDGATLRSVVGDLPVTPTDAGRVWIDAAELPRLRRELAEAEDEAIDGADQTLEVLEVRGGRVVLRWLGRTIVVRAEPPTVDDRFHPTTMAFAVGANYKLLPVLSGASALAVLPGVGADLIAAWHQRAPHPGDRGNWAPLAWSALATVTQTALTSTAGQTPGRTVGPPVPATANCTGAVLVWSSQWGRLDPAQRALVALPLACWVATMVRARPLGRPRWVIEAAYLAMPAVAAWRLTDRLDEEVDLVAASLHREIDGEAARAVAAAEDEVATEYREALAAARAALDRLGETIPDRLARHFGADCEQLEAWLADR